MKPSLPKTGRNGKIAGRHLADLLLREVDFSPVVRRLEIEKRVERDVNELTEAFCQWFSMFPLLEAGQVYVMLFDDVDEFYHTLIIHTKLYEHICSKYLGYTVHHHPLGESTPRSIEQGIPQTIQLLEDEFGDDLNECLQEWKYKHQKGAAPVSCAWTGCPNGHASQDVEGSIPGGVLVVH